MDQSRLTNPEKNHSAVEVVSGGWVERTSQRFGSFARIGKFVMTTRVRYPASGREKASGSDSMDRETWKLQEHG